MLKGINSLQSDGTMKHEDAIGERGQVYSRIRANESGKVQVAVDGTLRTLTARAKDKSLHIDTGEFIKVVDVIGSTLIVELLSDGDELVSEEE
jgi:membrane protein implicated in regulation of membrane protease activity